MTHSERTSTITAFPFYETFRDGLCMKPNLGSPSGLLVNFLIILLE